MSIPLTIENLYGGGCLERLHGALHEALQNIVDPNTPAKKPRKVKLELTIKPNEQRNMAEMIVSTSTTLCAPEPLETSITIGKDREGTAHAEEMFEGENPDQAVLPSVFNRGKVTLQINKEKIANA
jgi:hypothetical protein